MNNAEKLKMQEAVKQSYKLL